MSAPENDDPSGLQNNKDKDNDGDNKLGGGNGGVETGCCRPCGACELTNKCGTYICAIICTVWGAILCLTCLGLLGKALRHLHKDYEGPDEDTYNCYGYYNIVVYCLCFVVFILFLLSSILLICASKPRGQERRCWVLLWIWAAIVLCGGSLVLGIIVEIWYGISFGDNDYGYDYFNLFWLGVFTLLWIWYPWWIAYAYLCDLGGRSWCNCNNCS